MVLRYTSAHQLEKMRRSMKTHGVSLATLAAAALLLACEPDKAPLSPSEPMDAAALKTLEIFLSPNAAGRLGTVSTTGTIDQGNAFFRSFGTNGRTCATCHLQADAFGLSAQSARAVFAATGGIDPLFAPVDGANCPSVTPADGAAGHSLLLNHGLIRVGLTVPGDAEYTITAVYDPYGCALKGSPAEASVYRRVLPTTNLRFLSAVMWDGRETVQPLTDRHTLVSNLRAGLLHQALDATLGHAQAAGPPTPAQLNAIVDFELALFTAQQTDNAAGVLQAERGTGGPTPLATAPYFPGINDPLGDNPTGETFDPSALTLFGDWKDLSNSGRYAEPRKAMARGEAVFNTHPLTITGVAGLNDALGVAAINGTCTTCHDTPDVGNHSRPLPLDIGVSHLPTHESDPQVLAALSQLSVPELPVFKVVCMTGPLAGTVKYTSDPGRALISGKCADIGRLKGPILRGLAARAPFFHNGSAATLRQVVEFYNLRFQMGLTEREKGDLEAFLRAL
jgi:cytochrome c peroxidase